MKNTRRIFLFILLLFLFCGSIFMSVMSASERSRYLSDTGNDYSDTPEITARSFYYNTLSADEQQLYDNLKTAAEAVEPYSKAIEGSFSDDQWTKIFEFFLADNPHIFYLDASNVKLEMSSKKTRVKLAYADTRENVLGYINEFASELTDAVYNLNIPKNASDYEKALCVHDWIVLNLTYNISDGSNARFAHTAYGALVYRTALCDGYAYIYKVILDRIGVYSQIIYGDARGAHHMWNIFRSDGKFYYVDVTWDDPDLDFAGSMVFHTYFALPDDEIGKDHTIFYTEHIPSAAEPNYYRLKGLYADSQTSLAQIIPAILKETVWENSLYFELSLDLPREDAEETIKNAIAEYNKTASVKLRERIRIYDASYSIPGVIVQIFYV